MTDLEQELIMIVYKFQKRKSSFIAPGMSRGKFSLMMIAWEIHSENPDHKIRVSDLVMRMEIPAPGVSRIMRSLEEDGFLERMPDPEDRRTTLVTFTEKGEKKIHECQAVRDEVVHKVTASMGEDKIRLLCSLLEEYYEKTNHVLPEAVALCSTKGEKE